jgi:hypothetical protein
MTLWGFDYSWARPSASFLKSNGCQFVCRYLSWLPNGKCIDRAEFQFLLNLGVAVVLNWEYYAEDMIRGANHYADGQTHAREAERQRKALGAPECPIYFSADFDATPGQQAAINSYLDGVASIIGRDRTGIYASYYCVERTLAAGKAKWAWQTYAWSGGNVSNKAHLLQYQNGVLGGGYDRCRSLKDNFGQITKSGVANTDGASWMSNATDFAAVLKDKTVRAALVDAIAHTDGAFKSPYGTPTNPEYTLESILLDLAKRLDSQATRITELEAKVAAPVVAVDQATVDAAVQAAFAAAVTKLNVEVKAA